MLSCQKQMILIRKLLRLPPELPFENEKTLSANDCLSPGMKNFVCK